MGKLANEGSQLFDTNQPLAGCGQATDRFADWLLHRLDLNAPGGKLGC